MQACLPFHQMLPRFSGNASLQQKVLFNGPRFKFKCMHEQNKMHNAYMHAPLKVENVRATVAKDADSASYI